MSATRNGDAVDAILAQWNRERPDLDTRAMATIGRLKRCAALIQRELENTFADYDLTMWEFDVLATLRRAGAPYCLAPTELFSTLMITSGTMTHRMKKLETRGLIERLANPNDARSMLVQLTESGLELIDRAIEAHVKNEERILAPLKQDDQERLDEGLAKLLAILEPDDPK